MRHMNITKTTTYKVTFQVSYFEATEGGMDYDTFGKEVGTIQEAIEILEIARNTRDQRDWVIVADVQTTVK